MDDRGATGFVLRADVGDGSSGVAETDHEGHRRRAGLEEDPGDLQPLPRVVADRREAGFGQRPALGDAQAEVERAAVIRCAASVRAPRPGLAAGAGQLDPERLGRDRQPSRVRTKASGLPRRVRPRAGAGRSPGARRRGCRRRPGRAPTSPSAGAAPSASGSPAEPNHGKRLVQRALTQGRRHFGPAGTPAFQQGCRGAAAAAAASAASTSASSGAASKASGVRTATSTFASAAARWAIWWAIVHPAPVWAGSSRPPPRRGRRDRLLRPPGRAARVALHRGQVETVVDHRSRLPKPGMSGSELPSVDRARAGVKPGTAEDLLGEDLPMSLGVSSAKRRIFATLTALVLPLAVVLAPAAHAAGGGLAAARGYPRTASTRSPGGRGGPARRAEPAAQGAVRRGGRGGGDEPGAVRALPDLHRPAEPVPRRSRRTSTSINGDTDRADRQPDRAAARPRTRPPSPSTRRTRATSSPARTTTAVQHPREPATTPPASPTPRSTAAGPGRTSSCRT